MFELLCLISVAQVLFFIKYYDPFSKTLSFVGHLIESISQKFGEIRMISMKPQNTILVYIYSIYQ